MGVYTLYRKDLYSSYTIIIYEQKGGIKMIEINFNKKTIRGTAKVKDIREKGLIEASMQEE